MKLSENPTKEKKYKKEDSYVVKRVQVDKKTNFSGKCHDRKLARKDHNKLVKWFRKNKLFRK